MLPGTTSQLSPCPLHTHTQTQTHNSSVSTTHAMHKGIREHRADAHARGVQCPGIQRHRPRGVCVCVSVCVCVQDILLESADKTVELYEGSGASWTLSRYNLTHTHTHTHTHLICEPDTGAPLSVCSVRPLGTHTYTHTHTRGHTHWWLGSASMRVWASCPCWCIMVHLLCVYVCLCECVCVCVCVCVC